MDKHSFRTVFDQNTQPLAVLDAEGRILYLNQSGQTLLGWDGKSDPSGVLLASRIDPSQKETLEENLQAIFNGQTPPVDRFQVRDGKPSPVWISISGATQLALTGEDPLLLVNLEQTFRPGLGQEPEPDQDLVWLSKHGRILKGLSDQDEIFEYAGRELQKRLSGTIVVTLSNVNDEFFRLEGFYGLERGRLPGIWKILGGNFLGREFPIDQRYRDAHQNRLLHYQQGLEDLSSNQLSPEVTRRVSQLLNLDKVYTIGLVGNHRVMGSLYIITRSPDAGMNSGLVESFAYQVALALERSEYAGSLVESSRQFEMIFENAPDGYYITDLQGNFLDGNRAAERIIGYSRQELIGKNVMQEGLVSPEQLPQVAKLVARSLAGKATGPDEITLQRPDGETSYVDVSSYPVSLGGKRVVLGIARDISERKEFETNLERAHATLSHILDSLEAHVYVADMATYEIIYMNQTMADDFGGDYTGSICYQVFRDLDQPCEHCPHEKLLKPDGSPGEPLIWEGINNITGRWYQNQDRALYWLDKRLVKMQIAVDIQESKNAIRSLQRSEERYRSLFDSSQTALMTLAPPDWNFTSGNPALVDLFNLKDEQEFLSYAPWELSPEYQPDGRLSREKAREMIQIAVDKGLNMFLWTHKKVTGEEFPATVQLTRVDTEDEYFLQATVNDISDQVQAEKILRQQMADLGLINALNSAVNEGSDLDQILTLFGNEIKNNIQCNSTHVYLLNEDGTELEVSLLAPDETLKRGIESVVNKEFPEKVFIPLDPDSIFSNLIKLQEPRLITEVDDLRSIIGEMLKADLGPSLVKSRISRLAARMMVTLQVKSLAVVPIITPQGVIGLVDVVSDDVLTDVGLERLKGITDQLSGIIQRVRAEEDRAASLRELEMINKAFVYGSRLEDEDQICRHLADQAYEVNPDAYVMVSLLDARNHSIRLRAVRGLGNLGDRVVKILGKKPTEFEVDVEETPLSDELKKKFTSGKFEHVEGGLYDITRGILPKRVYKTLEKITGIERIEFVGFGMHGESTGGMIIALKKGQTVKYRGVLETITNHFGELFETRQAQQEVLEQKAQLEALRSVELDITSTLNLKELLHSIALKAAEMVNAASSGFSVYNAEKNLLEFLAYYGDHQLPDVTNIKPGEGLAGKVWETQQTQIVENYAQWSGRLDSWEQMGDYYLAGIPVRWGEERLGVLEIALEPGSSLSAANIAMLEMFAIQAAIAIKNARLFTAEKQRRQEAETLREVGMMINSSLDRAQLLDLILVALQKVVPYHSASIQLVQDEHVVIEAFRAEREFEGVIGKKINIIDNALAHPVLNEGRNIILDDVTGNPDWILGEETAGIHSWIGVPLEVMGRTIGLLTLDHRNVAQYSEEDARLALNFANQAAIAIENARLLESAQKQQREAETLRMVGMLISKTIDREEAMNVILDQLQYVLEYSNATIQLLEDDQLVVKAVRGTDESLALLGTSTTVSQENMLRSMLMEVEAVVIEDLQSLSNWTAFPVPGSVHAWLGVPLEIQGKRIGILTIDHVEVGRYSEHDAELVSAFAAQAAIALENSRLFEEAQQRMYRIESMRQIDLAISGSVDLEISMNVLVRQLMNSLDVDGATVLIYNPSLNTLDYIAGHGFLTDSLQFTSLRLGEGLAGKAAQQREIIQVSDLNSQPTSLQRSPRLIQEKFISYIAVPLIAKSEVVGVLEVFHRSVLDPDKEWFDFLDALAGQAAIAIDRLNLYNDLELSNLELIRAYDATIEGWAKAIELRDQETEGHSRRVVQLTMQLARRMGINGEALVNIRRGALLHDIGKMAIPDSILLKPDKLDPEEWRLMKEHPVFAYQMLSSIDYLKTALDIPYSHHERWDGAGYPQGLKEDQIPLPARIFAIVDVWDALQSDRPYRKAWTKQEAVEYIKEQNGKHFDPLVVSEFLDIIGQD